jgi:hypothetical protein
MASARRCCTCADQVVNSAIQRVQMLSETAQRERSSASAFAVEEQAQTEGHLICRPHWRRSHCSSLPSASMPKECRTCSLSRKAAREPARVRNVFRSAFGTVISYTMTNERPFRTVMAP